MPQYTLHLYGVVVAAIAPAMIGTIIDFESGLLLSAFYSSISSTENQKRQGTAFALGLRCVSIWVLAREDKELRKADNLRHNHNASS